MPIKRGFNFLISRLRSVRYAWAGLKDVLRTQHNAWVHLAVTVIVLGLSVWLEIDRTGFALIVFAIALVWVSEMVNTVFEVLADSFLPNPSFHAKRVKDIAAGAVLVACLSSVIIGFFVLGPPFYSHLFGE